MLLHFVSKWLLSLKLCFNIGYLRIDRLLNKANEIFTFKHYIPYSYQLKGFLNQNLIRFICSRDQ